MCQHFSDLLLCLIRCSTVRYVLKFVNKHVNKHDLETYLICIAHEIPFFLLMYLYHGDQNFYQADAKNA